MRVGGAGHDVVGLLAPSGVSLSSVQDPQARLPFATVLEIWRRAEALTGDPQLGIHVAGIIDLRLTDITAHGDEYVVVQLMGASRTVEEALSLLARYHRLANDAGSVALATTRDAAIVRLGFPDDPPVLPSFV